MLPYGFPEPGIVFLFTDAWLHGHEQGLDEGWRDGWVEAKMANVVDVGWQR